MPRRARALGSSYCSRRGYLGELVHLLPQERGNLERLTARRRLAPARSTVAVLLAAPRLRVTELLLHLAEVLLDDAEAALGVTESRRDHRDHHLTVEIRIDHRAEDHVRFVAR